MNAENGLRTWAWLHLNREVGLDVVKRDLHINQVIFLLFKCFIPSLFIISATVEINGFVCFFKGAKRGYHTLPSFFFFLHYYPHYLVSMAVFFFFNFYSFIYFFIYGCVGS